MTDCGGYDFDFVDTPPDEVICLICQYPSREPYLSVCCGHIFCKSCFDKCVETSIRTSIRDHDSSTVKPVCPVCRSTDFQGFPNKQADRKVRNLHVLCTNYQKGCQWQGEINAIGQHLDNDCHFHEILCPNNCGKLVLRPSLTIHQEHECACRTEECEHCHLRAEYSYISSKHMDECPEVSVACPNKCEAKVILRKNLNAHEKVCPLAQVKCKYYEIGCDTVLARQDEKEHGRLNDEYHFTLFMCYQDTMKSQLAHTENQIANRDRQLADKDQLLAIKSNQLAKANSELSQTKGILVETSCKLAKVRKQVEAMAFVHQKSIDTEQSLAFARQQLENGNQNLANTHQALAIMQQKFTNSQQILSSIEKELTKNQQKLADTQQTLSSTQKELTNNKQKLATTQQTLTSTQKELTSNKRKLADTQRILTITQINIENKFQTKIDKIETAACEFVDKVEDCVQVSEMAILLCIIIMFFRGYIIGLFLFIVLYLIIKFVLAIFISMMPFLKIVRFYVEAKESLKVRLQNKVSPEVSEKLRFLFFCLQSKTAEVLKEIIQNIKSSPD